MRQPYPDGADPRWWLLDCWCGVTVTSWSPQSVVGVLGIHQRLEHPNVVAAQPENTSSEGRIGGGQGAVNTPATDRTVKEFSHDRF